MCKAEHAMTLALRDQKWYDTLGTLHGKLIKWLWILRIKCERSNFGEI